MGRNKGESYRKYKLKAIHKVRLPNWTVDESLIAQIKTVSAATGYKPSRIIELAINNILSNPQHIPHNPAKVHQLFTKN